MEKWNAILNRAAINNTNNDVIITTIFNERNPGATTTAIRRKEIRHKIRI
jgi:hypothetical protein